MAHFTHRKIKTVRTSRNVKTSKFVRRNNGSPLFSKHGWTTTARTLDCRRTKGKRCVIKLRKCNSAYIGVLYCPIGPRSSTYLAQSSVRLRQTRTVLTLEATVRSPKVKEKNGGDADLCIASSISLFHIVKYSFVSAIVIVMNHSLLHTLEFLIGRESYQMACGLHPLVLGME